MKHALFFVRCKRQATAVIQHWSLSHSVIYSVCQTCSTRTDYDQPDDYTTHYDRFQIVITRNKGETVDAVYDRALAMVMADPDKYQVDEFGDPDVMLKRRMKLKE